MAILITAATTAQAHQLKNKLNQDAVILGDYLELPELMLKSGKMIRLPNPSSIAYNHEMLSLCLDRDIKVIYPLREEEAKLLAEAGQLFKEYNINIFYP